jgi:carbon monoxide dehydrogenase subunit G
MIVDRRIVVGAPANETFERVVDIPFVGQCLPGAAGVHDRGDGAFGGTFVVKVGPVKVTLEGVVSIVEQDPVARRAVLILKGSDRRVGGEVTGRMDLAVEESGQSASTLVVHTEFTISGKLGQFGQAVMLKKADQITEGFVAEFSRKMTDDHVLASVGAAEDTARVRDDVVPAAPSQGVPNGPASVGSERVSVGALPTLTTGPSEHLVGGGLDMVDPMPLLHSLLGLLRRSKYFVHVENRGDLADRSASEEPLWIANDAIRAGVRGADLLGASYVIEARLSSPDEVAPLWQDLTRAGLDRATAIALTPTGLAVTDLSVLAQVGARLAGLTGRPVLVVATTPWSLMSLARLAQTGVVHGTVADFGSSHAADVVTLGRLAVEEVRRAGLESPLVAGPVASASDEESLRIAGADAVMRRRRSRNPVKRVAAARRR